MCDPATKRRNRHVDRHADNAGDFDENAHDKVFQVYSILVSCGNDK